MTRWERTWWVWVRVGVPRRHRPRKEKNLRRALHSSFDRPGASRWSAKRTCCSCALYSARFALISAKVCGDSSSDMARGEPCAARDEREARCVVPRKRRRKVLLAEKSEAKHVKLRPSCRLTRATDVTTRRGRDVRLDINRVRLRAWSCAGRARRAKTSRGRVPRDCFRFGFRTGTRFATRGIVGTRARCVAPRFRGHRVLPRGRGWSSWKARATRAQAP